MFAGKRLSKTSTFSSYKHNETLKYMIGIAPSGAIIYISDGFGGRASDKYVTENSDFLSNLKPGHIVLSDRGFLIRQAVEQTGATLQMPAFRQDRLQLDPFKIEKTRHLAEVRIHVERVIG